MMFRSGGTAGRPREPCDVAVVVPTILRPSLLQAVRSLFAQDLDGRVHILVGVDVAEGDPGILDVLAGECPAHMHLSILDPGYSTSVRHGGLHSNGFSGALRTILSYLANSRYVAYLDDDNWVAPDHLSSLMQAIGDADWAYSRRWFVDAQAGSPLCVDDWESVGPGAGVYAEQYGGFVDPSSLMIDKLKCPEILPLWSIGPFADGSGEDRLVFEALRSNKHGIATGRATSFYRMHARDAMHLQRLQVMRERGIVLPAEEAAGQRSLRAVMDEVACRPVTATADPVLLGDVFLRDVVQQLKPREILGLGASPSLFALGALAQAAGLKPLALLVGALPPAASEAAAPAQAALFQFDPAASFHVAPGLGVDLAYVAAVPETVANLFQTAWRATRLGGLVIGDGEIGAGGAFAQALSDAAAALGATVHPATIPGHPRWLVQKDRDG
jgi:hypothetical protein